MNEKEPSKAEIDLDAIEAFRIARNDKAAKAARRVLVEFGGEKMLITVPGSSRLGYVDDIMALAEATGVTPKTETTDAET